MELLSRVTALRIRSAALAVALLVFGVFARTEAAGPQDDRYAPSRFGIPDTIGGYAVVAVLTEDNFACMKPGERRLVLQIPQLNIEDGIRAFPKERIEQELQAFNLGKLSGWGFSTVGPGETRDRVINQFRHSLGFFKLHGCSPITIPTSDCPQPVLGECKHQPPYPAYAIIQNTDIHQYSDVNAQSVIFVAPVVGDNEGGIWSDSIAENGNKLAGNTQYANCLSRVAPTCIHHSGFSALLNNGLTNTNYFLQVGLNFTNKATVDTQ